MTIGELIRRMRQSRNLTRAELARKITCDDPFNPLGTLNLDKSPSMKSPTADSVRKWEEGVTIPNNDALAALAYALGSKGDSNSLYRFWAQKRKQAVSDRSRLRRHGCI